RWRRVLGTRYLLMPADMVPPAGWKRVIEDPAPTAFDVTTGGMRSLDPYVLYENPNALPCAFIVGRVQKSGQMPTRSRARIRRRAFESHSAKPNWPWRCANISSAWSSHRCGTSSVSQWVRK